MDFVQNEQFYELFEKMIDQMNTIERFDREEFIDTLRQIAELFHISKGVTEFYINSNKEQLGEGEIMCDYDNGKGGEPIVQHRIVTKAQAIIKGTFYRPEDEPPLSERDKQRIDLLVRQLLSCN